MAISFLIPLTIALAAAYTRYQTQEEMVAVFATIIALINLVLSFVLAPWMVQGLILVGSFLGLRYFCYRHSCQNGTRLR
ncbi:hypothetical protein BST81_02965 [Leptolyngbya sp. 'hensonii']|uniref:hypothetical protein n=1 Tax=Leptolyngbya sp. 'hensonii' TaxID=1922337 RepID=UPI00094FF526|nr:hypothetical protein [Leptolyngbya sp. 'hensonii']OLP19941.1 hypothetical protein BST81_02965 [Leptolyngbya sp. 'hensonii']